MDLKFVLQEQRRQMEKYKRLRSDEAGMDLGETALLDWVSRFAGDFRDWAEGIPVECLFCGDCMSGETGIECLHPYNQKRLELIKDLHRPPEDS